jgi:hypothetical protein
MNIHLEKYKQQILESMKPQTSVINEAKLSPEQRERLDELIGMFSSAVDPEADYYRSEDDLSADEIINIIRSEFGDHVAQQVDDGAYIMHFPRDNNEGWSPGKNFSDPLDIKKEPRILKTGPRAGKMHPQDIDTRKRQLRSKFASNRKSKRVNESVGSTMFVLLQDIDYEGFQVFGVYSSEQNANKAMEMAQKEATTSSSSFTVLPVVVDQSPENLHW